MRSSFGKQHKSQSIIFEAVLIFSIALAIFIALYLAFTAYQASFVETSTYDQLLEVSNFMMSNIIKLAEKGDNMNSSVTLKIPRTVANEIYVIHLNESGLNVSTISTFRFFSFHGLNESLNFADKKIASTRERVTINKEGNQIDIY